MSEHQTRLARDVYDHEDEQLTASGRRRRGPVADWGVGEELFDQMPRRRLREYPTPSAKPRRNAPLGAISGCYDARSHPLSSGRPSAGAAVGGGLKRGTRAVRGESPAGSSAVVAPLIRREPVS